MVDGLIGPPPLRQGARAMPRLLVRIGEARVGGDGLLELVDGLVFPTLGVQGNAKHVVRASASSGVRCGEPGAGDRGLRPPDRSPSGWLRRLVWARANSGSMRRGLPELLVGLVPLAAVHQGAQPRQLLTTAGAWSNSKRLPGNSESAPATFSQRRRWPAAKLAPESRRGTPCCTALRNGTASPPADPATARRVQPAVAPTASPPSAPLQSIRSTAAAWSSPRAVGSRRRWARIPVGSWSARRACHFQEPDPAGSGPRTRRRAYRPVVQRRHQRHSGCSTPFARVPPPLPGRRGRFRSRPHGRPASPSRSARSLVGASVITAIDDGCTGSGGWRPAATTGESSIPRRA